MIRIPQVKLPLDFDEGTLPSLAARLLRLPEGEIRSVRIARKSVDARDKADIRFVLTLDVDAKHTPAVLPRGAEELLPHKPRCVARVKTPPAAPPLVVGMGPAGLFAALTLAQAGLNPIVIERGRDVDARAADVERFWAGGAFDPASNVQFGEGGAGTFSDGKLNSGIKDPRCADVLATFVAMGAPKEILYEAKPHIGTDHLKCVVKAMREEIIRLGGTVRFATPLTGIQQSNGALTAARLGVEEIPVCAIILAIGHSARDSFEMLYSAGVPMEQKAFSIGARVEHRQVWLNRAQYGAQCAHPALGAADYKLSVHLPDGRAVYTFCMCPGGQVVAAASEEGGVAVNGMSLFARDGENANSALLVSVGPGDFNGTDPLAGMRFQRKWERAAFLSGGGNYRAPAQLMGDFLKGCASTKGAGVRPSYRPGVTWTRLDNCLPAYVVSDLRTAIPLFDRRIRGFANADAVLTGVETRSSSPVRLPRDESLQSVGVAGLYPAGEGAGYAGGILSAAVDGMRCAEALIAKLGGEADEQ